MARADQAEPVAIRPLALCMLHLQPCGWLRGVQLIMHGCLVMLARRLDCRMPRHLGHCKAVEAPQVYSTMCILSSVP